MNKKYKEWLDKKVFFDGWDDISKLKYLPEDEIESYKKNNDSIDNFEYCIDIYQGVRSHKIKSDEWLETIYYPIPKTDKEIEYFLDNNLAYNYILYWCLQQIIDVTQKKMSIIKKEADAIKQKILEQYKKDFEKAKNGLAWLIEKQGFESANEFAKYGEKELKAIINRLERKPKGSPIEIIQRDNQIRAEYRELEDTLVESNGIRTVITPKAIREKLMKDFSIKSDQTLKNIIYDQNIKTPKKS